MDKIPLTWASLVQAMKDYPVTAVPLPNYTPTWTWEYHNDCPYEDCGPLDEWWEVTDGERVFDCRSEADAKWLCDLLNSIWG